MTGIIKLEHVSKKYPIQSGWRSVLNDVSFEMQAD